LAWLVSQLPKPLVHAPKVHVPDGQVSVAPAKSHTLLQALQLLSVFSGASQPLDAMPSQLPKLGSHTPSEHVPVEQLSAALVRAHVVLHAPQSVSVLSGVSQPLAAMPSQFAKPALHAPSVQVPVPQLAVALARLQLTLHPPQCVVVFVGCSQPLVSSPSQFAKPVLHVPSAHVPAGHVAVALVRAQGTPQPPQFVSVYKLCSQVVPSLSQSAVPAAQDDSEHTPPEQVRLSLTPHAAPHAPQLTPVLSGVSQPLVASPSQLPKPLLQTPSVQVPVPQLAVALAREHARLQPPQCVVLFSCCSQPLASFVSQLPNPLLQPVSVQVPPLQISLPLA
jgi:hypothetical protein